MWSVVTGYVEPGVDPLTQACQELDEELGLRSPDVRLVHSLPPVPLTSAASGKQFLVHPFLFESGDAWEAVLNWEHTALVWVEPTRLGDPDCVPWQRDIVLALLEQPG
jgi:8-oxo-dGTP pyrophosphatase MutT (NUDIX family)